MKIESGDAQEWLSPREAADELGVRPQTIYRWIQDGKILAEEVERPAPFRWEDAILQRARRTHDEAKVWRYRIHRDEVEKRRGENWHALTDAARDRTRRPKMRPYRRDGAPLVSDEEVRLCRPYGYMAIAAEEEKIREWWALFGRDNYDYTVTRDWRDDMVDEKRVLTKRQASDILGIAELTVRNHALRGTLKYIVIGKAPHRRMLFSREQVEKWAKERALRAERRNKTPGEWNYALRRPNIRTKIEAPQGDSLISTKEVAEILGVALTGVYNLVREGRLFGWQEHPGKHGSKLWLSYNQVERYSASKDRLARRARAKGTVAADYKAAKEPLEASLQEEWMEERRIFPKSTGVDRNHGEYFSSAQASRELGIGRTCLARLRMSGALMGYRLRRKSHPERFGGRPWWFYLKQDVWALKSDPEYQWRRRNGKGLVRP